MSKNTKQKIPQQLTDSFNTFTHFVDRLKIRNRPILILYHTAM